jgi:cell division protein FtsL
MMSRRLALVAVPVLWVAVLASAAGVIYVRHEARSLFIELEQLAAERDRLNIEWGQLQLEQSAWSNHGFVERVAHDKLQLVLPQPAEVRIVTP